MFSNSSVANKSIKQDRIQYTHANSFIQRPFFPKHILVLKRAWTQTTLAQLAFPWLPTWGSCRKWRNTFDNTVVITRPQMKSSYAASIKVIHFTMTLHDCSRFQRQQFGQFPPARVLLGCLLLWPLMQLFGSAGAPSHMLITGRCSQTQNQTVVSVLKAPKRGDAAWPDVPA